jgi:3-deoxy-manno-octulosonate cytidylyltransferase (CMP-KDO synthetase)
MKILGVIPARFASTRFPGKPLVDINGKTMIQRVYEQAKKCKSLARVVVATDDERIFQHVQSFGGEAIMTAATHQSGTDRCAEVVEKLNFEIQTSHLDSDEAVVFDKITPKYAGIFTAVINIQGDEPFIQPEQIEKVVEILRGPILIKNEKLRIKTDEDVEITSNVKHQASNALNFDIATLAKRIDNQGDIENPNVVKAVFGEGGRGVYFSRSPIPFLRNMDKKDWATSGQFFKHIGLYGYKTNVLLALAQLPPSRLEGLESLEQLRWLENGYAIGIAETDLETIGIDTPEDLKKVSRVSQLVG